MTKRSVLEEQVAYLLEEETEVTADSSTADSGENQKYTASLKRLEESKKRLLKAQDELGDEELSEEDEALKGKIGKAVDAIDDAMKSIKQESADADADDEGKDKKVAEEGKGKKKLHQNQNDGDDTGADADDEGKDKKVAEEGKGKKKLHQNEDGEDDPEFVNEENDDNDEDDKDGKVEEEGKGKKK